ncbi:LPS-assembly protein LptD [Maricaulis sp. CAU 1757]
MTSCYRRLAAMLWVTTSLVIAGPALGQDVEVSDAPVYLEADSLEDIAGVGYVARGNVRVRQQGRTVLADELIYRPDTNRVLARGNVVIVGQTPYPQYADEVELDSALSTGVALGFASELENQGRIAAAAAIRRENGSLQLDDAYYTACALCEDGEGNPTWRLRASEVVQDAEEQMIYYRDARFEVLGVPVLYAPVFAHPDPSSERRSGFLLPSVGASSRLGFVYQQPYYWAISEHQDLTVAPRAMTNVNPLLFTQYRKRFWSGSLAMEGSLTREFEIDGDGERYGEEDWRWHLFGGGRFAINEDWRWGFGVQRTSDDLHLRRYDFSEIDIDRGAPLIAPTRSLVSQLYAESRTESRYISAISATYQDLRPTINDDTLPIIAPMLRIHQILDGGDRLGRTELTGDLTVLEREQGTDYRRASVEIDWRTRWATPQGLVIEPFAYGRTDYYSLSDLPLTGARAFPEEEDDFSRVVGLVGTEFSYPFFRPGTNVDWVIEPVAAIVASSDDTEASRIFNEDSQGIDLSESMLFEPKRVSGFDVWENGVRADYGVRATALWGDRGRAQAFIGRSERFDGDAVFGPSSGLFEDSSDYVFAGEIFIAGFAAIVDTRLDTEDLDINRLEVEASYVNNWMTATLGYLDSSDDASRGLEQRELRSSLDLRLVRDWSLIARDTYDLDRELLRGREIGFAYQDDCTRLEIVYQRENLGISQLGPSESIQVRVTLFTLGSVDPD